MSERPWVEAFNEWVQGEQGVCLSLVPIRGDVFQEQILRRLYAAFKAGYRAAEDKGRSDV